VLETDGLVDTNRYRSQADERSAPKPATRCIGTQTGEDPSLTAAFVNHPRMAKRRSRCAVRARLAALA
jgi:hypothetical protein